jgi:hypothetical protein
MELIGMQLQTLKAQIVAMQLTIDALQHLVDVATLNDPQNLPDLSCSHPEEFRQTANNIGEAPSFFCGKCRQIVKES